MLAAVLFLYDDHLSVLEPRDYPECGKERFGRQHGITGPVHHDALREQHPEYEESAHCLKRHDYRERDHEEHDAVVEFRVKSRDLCLFLVEAEENERPPSEEREDSEYDDREELHENIRKRFTQDFTEWHFNEVA
jgi:hypothetical protein